MRLFAASIDDAETQTKFAKELGVSFPILADPEKKAARAMGVLSKMGYANRHTVYIGKDGKLLAIDTQVNVQSAGEDVVKKLGELKIAKRKTEKEPASRPKG